MKILYSPASRLLVIGTFWLVLFPWQSNSSAQDVAASVPLWKQGVSRFNGSGYDDPPQNTSSTAAESMPSYTVPKSPGVTLHSNPYLNLPATATITHPTPATSFAGTDVVLNDSDADSSQSQATSPAGSTNSASNDSLPVPLLNSANGSGPPGKGSSELGAVLQQDAVVEVPPLQDEVIRWYQYPIRWMKGWDSNAEFGIDGSNGNATTLALQMGLELKRKTDRHTFAVDVDYRQASSRNVTTEDNGRLNIDYDRLLADTPWSAFGKFGMEWDKFKAFDLRLNLNGGLGYHWIRTDEASLITRVGAGASNEIGSPDEDWTPEGVFGLESERQLTARQKVKAKVDYFPAWEDFSDYRLVSDVSWEVLLDGSDNLSLKLAATDRYDSTPQGAKPNDLYYSLLLLYKF